MVRELLAQIEAAVNAGAYHLALLGALAIPSICAALESPGGDDTPAKYADWFDVYVGPAYSSGPGSVLFSGDQCYSFRCGMLHQGKAIHKGLGYSRVLFLEPSSSIFHRNIINGALNLDIRIFCADIVRGAKAWLAKVEGTEPYQSNWETSFHRRPSGLKPYVAGAPVYS
jgi:hypothetical protein